MLKDIPVLLFASGLWSSVKFSGFYKFSFSIARNRLTQGKQFSN